MNVVHLPERNAARSIPDVPRDLADAVERGDFDAAHQLAWVIDCGGSRIELGLLGPANDPGADGHLLFTLAQRRLEHAALGIS